MQNLFHFIVHIFLHDLIPLILLCLLLVRWEMSSMGLLFFVLFIPGSDSLWHHWSLWSFLLLCRGKRNNCILFVFRGGLFVRADKKRMKCEFLIDKFMLVSMDTTDIYMYVTVIKEFVKIFVNMQLMCDFVIES